LIYICIPTHNEQQTVGVVLWKLRQVLTEFPRDYQLLVADDASSDKTIEVLEPYTRVLPLTVISSEHRQGHAASLEMLLREAIRRSEYPKRDVIVTLQADFSEEPDDVVALIKRMEAGADVAVGIKVSSVRETRLRRLARSLSHFFTRRQKWPDGVVTPFDGYRAYRLHAVKRAIEERNGARLLHYDGWAGHAELLRAVLPHARRVDALNVEDRPDRLQRPRRERPLAAAWQVRAMASGQEPAGLVPVEELDRIAATASRRRERPLLNGVATPSRDRKPAGAESRSRGARPAPARGERGEPERNRTEGARPRRPEGAAAARDRTADRSAATATPRRRDRKPTGTEPVVTDAPARSRGRRANVGGEAVTVAATAEAAGVEAQPGEQSMQATDQAAQTGADTAPPAEGAAPKKRRRRRRGKGGAATQTAGAEAAGSAESAEGSAESAAGATRSAEGSADSAAGATRSAAGAAESAADSATPAAGADSMAAASPGAGSNDAGGDGGDGGAEGDAAERSERKRRRRGGRGRRRSKRPAAGDAEAMDVESGAAEAAGMGETGDSGVADRSRGALPGGATPAAQPKLLSAGLPPEQSERLPAERSERLPAEQSERLPAEQPERMPAEQSAQSPERRSDGGHRAGDDPQSGPAEDRRSEGE
jgi:hypothetical protein